MSRQGRHGAARFLEICQALNSELDVVINGSAEDMHGWDFVVDISPPSNDKLPPDLEDHLFQCFVQIKTTKGEKPSASMKLSNAVKSAKNPLPFYIFLFHYPKIGNEPILYGVHIWEDEIRHYLKRARESETINESALHKSSVTKTFQASDKIEGNPTDWMFDRIKERGYSAYSVNKKNLIDTIGYNEFSHTGNFNIVLPGALDDLVKHEIGLIEELSFTEFRMFDNRFGIRSEHPTQEAKSGKVRIGNEGRDLILQIRSQKGGIFDLPAKAWIPHLIGPDDPAFRVRVDAGHVSFVASFSEAIQNLNLAYDRNKELPLVQHAGYLVLMDWLKSGPVELRAQAEIGQLFRATVERAQVAEPWMDAYRLITQHLLDILGSERCSDIRLSLAQINSDAKDLHYVSALASGPKFQFMADFADELEAFELLMGYVYGQIGDWTYGVIYEADLQNRSVENGRYTFEFGALKIVRRFAFRQDLNNTKQQIAKEFEFHRESTEKVTAILQGGDLMRWSKSLSDDGQMTIDIE